MAQSVNNVVLTGNVCRKPELKTTQNGKKYTFITIAVNRMVKDTADFISFIAWEKLAENACKYLERGAIISILGSLETVKKGDNTFLQVRADSMTFLKKGEAEKAAIAEPTPAPAAQAGNNLPFTPETDVFFPYNQDPFAPGK